jgi:phenylalanyl-tRNA synthetase beta chain
VRVNLEWLRDWVDVDDDGERLAEELTTAGLEVDSVLAAAPPFDGVVVGRVVECRPHPRADRLSLCLVDDGRGRHEVVCGAPNVRADVTVAFAPVGSKLPDGTVIVAAELRGVASNGMLCSARELELADDVEGILILDGDAPLGAPLREHLKLDDSILDIDITPNRGDCFSVIGIAREIAAKRNVRMRSPALAPVPASTDDELEVDLRAGSDCPRFAGRVVRGVRAGLQSPLWMRERLRRAGLRAIHPIVDVTNYVMLELGQPLHAYDLTKLEGGILVRHAVSGEKLTLLDGQVVDLAPDVLVIADGSGAIGMAGVMGGSSTAVSADTVDVFLESAYFSPDVIAGRARAYGLHTDASLRFERGVDPEAQERAIERATALLLEISGGRPGPTCLAELEAHIPKRPVVPLRRRRVEALLGIALDSGDIESLLTRLDIELRGRDGEWQAVPPSFRFDINIEEDLVEEIGRLLGYDRIPAIAGTSASHLGAATELRVDEDRLADLLTARGYMEVVTYSFVDEALDRAVTPDAEPVALANPISSDMGVLRSSLWPGLLLVARQNLSRQRTRFRLFEIGRQFAADGDGVVETPMLAGAVVGSRFPEHWDQKAVEADFFDVKADVRALLALGGDADAFRFEPATHPALRPGQAARIVIDAETAGWLGVIHPELQRVADLRRPMLLFSLRLDVVSRSAVPAFRHYPKFPTSRRDLAVVVDREVPAAALVEQARLAIGDTLRRVVIFDVYTGTGIDSGRKSVALGLILQGVSRTLTDADADRAVDSVTQRLERELGATIRT